VTNKLKHLPGDLVSVSKLVISLAVTLTAFLGYIAYSRNFAFTMIAVVSGVFLMAAGSSAMNHYQERNTDRLMDRTRNRPIPSGRIKAKYILWFGSSLLLMGGFILLSETNPISFMLGIITFIWYNLIYTPLKKITAFAVFPGSVIGAIPPLIGWTAAGGSVFEPTILAIAFFFFMGQIPHFWLILLKNGKDYEKAGLASLTNVFNEKQIRQLTFFWIVATVLSSLVLVFFRVIFSEWLIVVLSVGSLIYVISSISLPLETKKERNFKMEFIKLNIFYMLVMLLIIIQYLP
jgi:heme o synthase